MEFRVRASEIRWQILTDDACLNLLRKCCRVLHAGRMVLVTARDMHRPRTRVAAWPRRQACRVEALPLRGAAGSARMFPAGAEAGEVVLE